MAEKYKTHPAANLFPLEEETIDTLAEDIKAHGLLTPIELYRDQVLDGRRRLRACKIAGVEPDFVTVSPADPVAYVLSLNTHRRHLTQSQLAMVAARARGWYDEQAKKRMLAGKKDPSASLREGNDKAASAAGKALGVSGRSVEYATKVLKKATPELVQAVTDGKIAVSTAAVYAGDSVEEQEQLLANPRNQNPRKPRSKPKGKEPSKEEIPAGKSRGKGIQRAHEAIACLKRIPKNDALRKRGFQVVTDWIKYNK